MTIRLATCADVETLAEIEQLQPFSAGWKQAGLKSELENRASQIWVSVPAQKPVGFVALRAAGGMAEILNVAVHPNYCRQGIASNLLHFIWAELKALRVDEVTLEVNANNAPALALYRKAGFTPRGRRVKFYHNTDDALIMGKNL